MSTIINKMVEWPRWLKQVIQLSSDVVFISGAFAVASYFWVSNVLEFQHLILFTLYLSIFIGALAVLRVYSTILRFLKPSIFLRLVISAIIAAISTDIVGRSIDMKVPDRFYFDLALLSLLASLVPRLFFSQLVRWRDKQAAIKVAIYGAGEAGRQLKSALDESKYKVVAFLDDRKDLQHSSIYGINVYSPDGVPRLVKSGLEEICLALPSASRERRNEIMSRLEGYGLKVSSVPGLEEIVSGEAELNDLQQVSAEDLLARDPIPPHIALMEKNIRGQSVLVTGAGGTIGSQLCREIITHGAQRLVLFEHNEYALYQMHSELEALVEEKALSIDLVPVLGSACDEDYMFQVLSRNAVNSIYHSAAYKHVPMVELNTVQGVKNNVLGTWATVQAALRAKVSSFVLVSTDKAVRPPNIMGASKRVAELCVQAAASDWQSSGCAFSIVRFGNVLGSSGSVIPKFKQQIAMGGPVTVTHEDMTRYFMTVEEAAQLVVQAGAMGNSGEVYVLDMGTPVSIYELAKKSIHLHGLSVKSDTNPYGDVEIEIVGPRPGEKLFEELLIKGAQPTQHDRIFQSNEPSLTMHAVKSLVERLKSGISELDEKQLRAVLESVPEIKYRPRKVTVLRPPVNELDSQPEVEQIVND